MFNCVKKFSCFILIFSLATLGWPSTSTGERFFVKGEENADDAARFGNSRPAPSPSLRTLNSFHAQPDSTETVPFEEEEERNLVKEITVWIIGAAFVGYFIVKVFLEGDTEETEEEKSTKKIPGSAVIRIVPSDSFSKM